MRGVDGPLAFLGDFIDGGGQGVCDRTILTRVRGLIDTGGCLLDHGRWLGSP